MRYTSMPRTSRILLVIGGGIAAYKCLEFIRRAREGGAHVRAIMTKAAAEFVTPLSVSALTGERVLRDLFDPDDEHDIGHIRLSREADVIVVAPATADLMARMAGGQADDLATAMLLAADKSVLIAPAMNPRMWAHPATQRNLAVLQSDGVTVIGPEAGEMAESGEAGVGRMAEPAQILAAVKERLCGAAAPRSTRPLAGRRVLVTAGPTHEPIDPVRYIANRSSGKQGYAIAAAARALGAEVTLISGPVGQPRPAGVQVISVETARDMLAAVRATLPCDVGVFTAAVADWRTADTAAQKMKKTAGTLPVLSLTENPDILKTIANDPKARPALVIGFAAETENVLEHAQAKLKRKGCDWIVANDVSPQGGVMGGDRNTVHIVRLATHEADHQTAHGTYHETWPEMAKEEVAERLMLRAADELGERTASA